MWPIQSIKMSLGLVSACSPPVQKEPPKKKKSDIIYVSLGAWWSDSWVTFLYTAWFSIAYKFSIVEFCLVIYFCMNMKCDFCYFCFSFKTVIDCFSLHLISFLCGCDLPVEQQLSLEWIHLLKGVPIQNWCPSMDDNNMDSIASVGEYFLQRNGRFRWQQIDKRKTT